MAAGTVLVTGAAGAVGHGLVECLHADGRRVIASDLPGTDLPARKKNLLVRSADLTDPRALPKLVQGAEQVVHAAALVDLSLPLEQLEAVNIRATQALFQAAADAGAKRFVFVSAGSIYRLDPAGVYRETNPIEASSDYERTKILAEQCLLSAWAAGGPEVVVLRPSPIYGPRARNLGASLACLGPILAERLPFVVGLTGGPRINWVHAHDVARAAQHLLEVGQPGEAYNISDDDAIAFGDLVSHSLRSYGLEPTVTLPYPPLGLLRGLGPLLDRSAGLFTGLNRLLQSTWERIRQREGLESALQPRLDREALVYGNQDFLLLNEKLTRTGFRLRYPSILAGWEPTLAWYQANRWVPRRPSV
jgi:nucleoside-diphosphate-sugar epimerase